MAGYTVTWNGDLSTDIPELVIGKITRSMFGKLRGEYLDIPGVPGARFYSEKRGIRKITLECFVEAATFPAGRRDAVTAVCDWLEAVEGEAELILGDDPGVYYLATLGEPPDPDEWREFGVFDIVFYAQPYSYDTTVTQEIWTSTGGGHTWNSGLTMVQYPLIVVTPTGGPLTALELHMNGLSFFWTGTLLAGKALYIYCEEGLVYNTDAPDEVVTGVYDDAFDMVGVTGDFLYLDPGSNTLSVGYTGTASSVDVTVSYRKQYRK